MPLVFIVVGLVLILTGLKGDPTELYDLVKGDFTGPNNFVYWSLAIFVLGAIGYIPSLRNLSRLFIVLVVLVLLVNNRGFFSQLQSFINSSQTQGAA